MVTCTGHIGIHEGADVRTENDVMAILPNFLPSMGYQYFLSYGAPHARAKGARGAPLKINKAKKQHQPQQSEKLSISVYLFMFL